MNTAEYQKTYHLKWYQENKEKRKLQAANRRRLIRKWFKKYKGTLSCLDCGESSPAVLDFHHKRDKVFVIANAASTGFSIERIKSEIEKCDVLCANCHRRRHYKP